MSSKKETFPVGTLVHFAIAQNDIGIEMLLLALGTQSNAAGNRQTVAQRACRYFDAGDMMGGMAEKQTAVGAVCLQLFFRIVSDKGQGCIE